MIIVLQKPLRLADGRTLSLSMDNILASRYSPKYEYVWHKYIAIYDETIVTSTLFTKEQKHVNKSMWIAHASNFFDVTFIH